MKINVDNIPEEGLNLAEKLDPAKMLLDVDSQGVNFSESIDAKAKIRKSGAEVFIEVSLESPVEYTCSRCLAKFTDVFKKAFNVNYEVKSGDVLAVDEDIRQEMILDSPMKVMCKPDCKGLCPNCGQNLNVAECECEKE